MTRDDLRGIVEGITDEQLKKILDINSSDIGRAKLGSEKLATELEDANQRIADMEKEAELLREGQGEAEEMKKRVEELQKVLDQKAIDDQSREKSAELEGRFSEAVGNARFLNDYTRKGVFDLFCAAVEAEENEGVSDQEIFSKLTKGTEKIFSEETEVPSVVASTSGFGSDLSQSDIREIMGLEPR